MIAYADSSFLLSSVILDANSSEAQRYLQHSRPVLPYTLLHELEVANALELAVFRQRLTSQQVAEAALALRDDLENGRLTVTTIRWPAVFRRAQRLSKLHTRTTGARSLDVLHIAAAISLHSEQFASFDKRQRALAALAGLVVVP